MATTKNYTLDKMTPKERRDYRANQKRNERKAKKERGLVPLTAWVAPQYKSKVIEYIEALNAHAANAK